MTVMLVLPEEEVQVVEEETDVVVKGKAVEENEGCEATAIYAYTQSWRPRRRGGRGTGSRMKRMFAFQLQLSLKRGLPLSRLLNQHFNTKAKQELLKVQEESASAPRLR